MLLTLAAGTVLLLRRRWDEVIDVAKQIAPVFMIVSPIASALLSVLAWFRKRRQRRLAAQDNPIQRQPFTCSAWYVLRTEPACCRRLPPGDRGSFGVSPGHGGCVDDE
ncbi:hypothetical protein ACH5A2_21905 [Streptomyces collinus]|uniref:hypothetical protein n=1 Tax=Streptomyces collinus TaxID=42684 RepID=UPI0037BC1E31